MMIICENKQCISTTTGSLKGITVQDDLTQELYFNDMSNFSMFIFSNYSLSDLEFDSGNIQVLTRHRIWPFFFWITFVVGMIGNWLVVYVLCRKKQMRTVTNMFLLNLAIVDILYLLTTIPNTSYWTDYWPFGGFMCK